MESRGIRSATRRPKRDTSIGHLGEGKCTEKARLETNGCRPPDAGRPNSEFPINYKGQKMKSAQEPELPGKTGAASTSAPIWTYASDDSALPEGQMAPVYPLGVNVLLVRVGGAVYAVSGKCAHMACPLSEGRLEGYTIVCGCHDWRFDV